MDLKLINDLNESRQYRSKSAFRNVTAREISDLAFMDMIGIWILYNEFDTAPAGMSYAERTAAYNRFTAYRTTGTDLYLALHVITEKRADLLSNEADAVLLDRIQLDVPNIIRYLRAAAHNNLTISKTRQTLQRLEQALHIDNSNYRSVRRLAQSWPTLSTSQKRTVLTRMILFYKTHARRSEMFAYLEALAKSKNLYDKNASDPEKTGKFAKAAAVGAAGAAGFATGYQIGKALV